MAWHIMPVPEMIDTPERMMQVCRHIRDTGICGLDTETTGLCLHKDIVLFWSLAPDLKSRYCLDRSMLRIFKKEISEDPSITWVMTNANYDNNILANSGVPLMAGDIYCTLVEDWMYDENAKHGLKEVSQRYLGLNMREFKSVFKKGAGETYQDALIRMMKEKPAEAIDYASMDAWASLAVHQYLKPRLENIVASTGLSLWELFCNIEVPYTKVLYNCIRRGIMVDVGWLEELRGPIDVDMEKINRKVNKIVGREVNLNSNPQLQDIFINQLGYEPIKWTSGGASGNRKPSVDASVLNQWARDGDEIASYVVAYRGLGKTKGTYIDGMISRCDPGFRIHPNLTQYVAVTGRLTSKDPNLQNIPRPDDDVYGLRGAFMPGTGYTLVAADYGQLEMRLLAQMSGDVNMQKVICEGKDIHMGTASLMYGVPYEEIARAKKEAGKLEAQHIDRSQWDPRIIELMGFRQDAKAIGFGQQRGRSKTCSKRGNLSATHRAIPCCAARRSVSTCDRRQAILNGLSGSTGLGSQSRTSSLTRQANRIRFGVWQRGKRSYVSNVGRRRSGRAITKNAAPSASALITSRGVASAGTVPTLRRDTIKQGLRTTIGRVVAPQSITNGSHVEPTATNACFAANRLFSFTIKMATEAIPIRVTSKSYVNVAIRWKSTTALPISQSGRRYSQCPWKQGNNTINYGKGDRALAEDLGITVEEAKARKIKYFEPYPSVQKFIEFTHEFCREFKEVSTILGRKRRLTEADADWKEGFYHHKARKWVPERPGKLAARALRQDVNAIIQGSAADVVRLAQIECEESPVLRALGIRQLLQIHDEIIFEVPNEHLEEGCAVIRDIMEHPFRRLPERTGLEFDSLAVPLDVDIGYGEAWSEAH